MDAEGLKAKARRLFDLAVKAATTLCIDRCGAWCSAECQDRFAAIVKEKP